MPTKTPTILLADDDLEDFELFKDIILAIEPTVTIKYASNGKEVIDLLSKCSSEELPCLMIIDYNMPQMTGAEVLSEISTQKRYQSIVKVVFSTSSSKSHMKQCLNHGASDYFVKPGSVKELQSLTKKILSIRIPGPAVVE